MITATKIPNKISTTWTGKKLNETEGTETRQEEDKRTMTETIGTTTTVGTVGTTGETTVAPPTETTVESPTTAAGQRVKSHILDTKENFSCRRLNDQIHPTKQIVQKTSRPLSHLSWSYHRRQTSFETKA